MAPSATNPKSLTTTSADDDWVDVNLTVRAKPASTDHSTSRFYEHLNQAAIDRLKSDPSPLFWVDFQSDLYETFVQALPEKVRQEYNCNACRAFVNRYGRLALVKDNGELLPLMWNSNDTKISTFFRGSIQAVVAKFATQKVTREFKAEASKQTRGFKEKGGFNHMFLTFPQERLNRDNILSSSTKERVEMLERVLNDYDLNTIKKATHMLEQRKLPHADNHKAAARWLLSIVQSNKIEGSSNGIAERRWNLIHRYAVSAFTGCLNQLRSGALATLLDNIKADVPFKTIEQEWTKIVDPLQYLRPQAAPKAGNIAASERLFKDLGITENDTRRRFLVLDDVPDEARLWQRQKPKSGGGMFANVTPRESKKAGSASRNDLPPTTISFTKLVTKILPKAQKIEYKLDTRNGLYFFITGLEETKPLMQWHSDTNRASWYIYTTPYPVESHNLMKQAWNEVTSLIAFPHLWDGAPLTTTFPLADEDSEQGKEYKYYHKAKGFNYLFVLENIKDTNADSLCLFPTLLKSEFHGARATIERFSGAGKKEYVEDVDAKGGYVGGVEVSAEKSSLKHLVRVTDQKGDKDTYEVLTWD